MQHISGNLIVSRWPIMNGSAQNPALNFSGANQSGISYSNTVNIHVIQNTPLVIQNTGITIPGTCAGTKFIGNGAQLTMIPPLALSNVQIVDATNVPLDDTALDSSNQGYLRLNGRGFAPGSLVSVGNTLATSATMYSQQQLFAQIPPKSAGTYSISITRADGISTTLPMAVSFSPFPVWTSATTLANVVKTVAFTQTLSASEGTGSSVSYALTSGSALPSGVTLSSGGIVSGNITTDPGNATTYYFSIDAVDAQFQNIPRTFGLTALGSYPLGIAFTSSATYVIHSPATVKMLLVGGGGGGRGGNGSGGGAGYITSATVTLTMGQQLTITIGGGGTAGTSGVNGGNGGVTSVSGTELTTIASNGGVGGGAIANGSSGGGAAEPSSSNYASGVGGSGGSNGTRSGSNYGDSGLGIGMGTVAFAAAMSFNTYYAINYNFRAGAAGTRRPATVGISWGGTGGGGVICDNLVYPTAGNGGTGTGAQGFGAGASSTREVNVDNSGTQGQGAPGLVYLMVL